MDIDNQSTAVLIVEDAVFVRTFIVNALHTIGITDIAEADNGQSALEILNEKDIDIVLSDWHMPQMEGIELLKAMRADERYKTIPFLMLTSDVTPENVQDAIQSGVSDLLAKPFRHAPLIQKVKRLLEQGHNPLSQTA